MGSKIIAENFNSPEAVATYQSNFLSLKERYLRSPRIISIETYAKCDAKCDFCPYVSIDRIGAKMSDALIDKIISDIGDLDKSLELFITIARINEPFLDKRIFAIAQRIHEVAPQAQFIYFSNGSPLVDAMMDRFEQLPRTFCLSLSFNDHRKEAYERIMQIPFERALARFDAIHARKQAGRLPFWTRVTKVADNNADDEDFIAYVRERWPLFDSNVYRRATWSGAIDTTPSEVPDAGCAQWFSIGFYADGSDPFCVMDSNGLFRHGNIATEHLLDIYNHPFRLKLRTEVINRKDVDYCRRCPLMS